MDALGPPAAERAARHDPAGLKGEGNRGVSGIEVPGFEPNAGPVRQKVREKVHALYLVTQPRSSKMAKSPVSIATRAAAFGALPPPISYAIAGWNCPKAALHNVPSSVRRERCRRGTRV